VAERLFRPPWSATLERAAEGVWLVRGDLRRGMNVYLLEDEGGVTAFDAGTKPMVKAVQAAAERLGGLRRVVLGHSHTDHRGTAPYLGVPVLCHPDEVASAETDDWHEAFSYWDIDLVEVGWVRWLYKHHLHDRWDGGAVEISGTVSEGDEVCGFEVVHFPGHAPGQIGLWRESDRVALTTDVVYFADSDRLKQGGPARVPGRAWNLDHRQAIASTRKLAALGPAVVLPGHGEPITRLGLIQELEHAAETAEDEAADAEKGDAGAADAGAADAGAGRADAGARP